MARSIASAAIVIGADVSPLGKGVDRAKSDLAGLDRAARDTGRTARKEMAEAGVNLTRLRETGRVLGRGTDYGGRTKALRDGLAVRKPVVPPADANPAAPAARPAIPSAGYVAAAATAAGTLFVKQSLNLAGEAEVTRTAFRLMTGEITKADAALTGLKKLAAESPLSSRDVITNAKQLMAFGVAADDLVPTVRALGDVSIGTGTDLQRMAYAYGQVRTAGRLFGTELKQFTEAGVPIIDALAKVLGKPKDQIRDLVEAGRVSAGDVTRAFDQMTAAGGKFHRLGAEGAKTYTGRVEQLKDAVERAQVKFGDMLIQELRLTGRLQSTAGAVDKAAAGFDDLRPAVRLAGDYVRETTDYFGELGAVIGSELRTAGAVIGHLLPDLTDLSGITREWMAVTTNGMRQMAVAAGVVERVLPAVVRAVVPEFTTLNGVIETGRQGLRDLALVRLDPARIGAGLFAAAEAVAWFIGTTLDGLEAAGRAIDAHIVDPFERAKYAVQDVAIAVGVLAKVTRDSAADPVRFAAEVVVAGGAGRHLANEIALATPVRPAARARPQPLVGWHAGDPVPAEALTHRERMVRGVRAAHDATMPGLLDWKAQIGRDGLAPLRDLAVAVGDATGGFRLLTAAVRGAAAETGRLRAAPETPAHLRELAQRLNDPKGEFVDPVAKFLRETGEIRDAMTFPSPERFDDGVSKARAALLGVAGAVPLAPKLIGSDIAARALVRTFNEFTKDAQALQFKLPQPVEYGSREAAAMFARSMGRQTPEDLLQTQIAIERDQLAAAREMAATLLKVLGTLGHPTDLPTP